MRIVMRMSIVLATVAAFMVAITGQTMATPAMGQKEGAACNKCHTTPPALNDFGKKYKK